MAKSKAPKKSKAKKEEGKAMFAAMESEGTIYPKNSAGNRTKPKVKKAAKKAAKKKK